MNEIEQKYVHNTYQKIYKYFDSSRAYLWESVKIFLDNIPKNSIILECGSGNGKNLEKRKDCINIAFDLCSEFCKITQKKKIDSIVANNLMIPFKNNSIDFILSIAVIHHLSSWERRKQCIEEMIRILKPGGKLMIQVWAFEQSNKSKNKFNKQENLISFKNPQQTMNEFRYYYVFKKNELYNMVSEFDNIKILESYWEAGNWIIICEKIPPIPFMWGEQIWLGSK